MEDNIISYFIIYSFLGWCLESIYKTVILKKPVNSGFLYGPFCPMYGIGAILMILIGDISKNVFIVFFIACILFTVWEYIVAIILEKVFKTKYWDYSHLKFNFQGRICLKNSIYWGVLGILLIFVIQPQIELMLQNIPVSILIYIDGILCFAITIDAIITTWKTINIDSKIKQIFEIGENIKEKLIEIKGNTTIETNYKENIQKLISEMKMKQDLLKIKIYKRIIRLKKSFPNMNSENISKFMKQKIELKELKEKIKKYKER